MRREKIKLKLNCMRYKVLRENNGSGLDIGGGGDVSDLVWEGRRQAHWAR